MARRPTPPSKPERPVLTVEQKRRCIDRLNKCIEDLKSFDPQTVQKRYPPEVTALENTIDGALSAAFGHGTVEYRRRMSAGRLDQGPATISFGAAFSGGGQHNAVYQARQYLAEGKERSIVLLQEPIGALEDQIADQEHEASSAPPTQAAMAPRGCKVFVVHGHDEAARQGVARFLEQLGLEAIILSEQPDQGRTIIEKFEDCAADVGFAVVLLTPDDLAASASRARQNVIFELGYFAGKLGRGRTCLVRKGVVEIPSDLFGVIYTDMDAADSWKLKLVKELKAAKLDFDANRIW